MPLQGSSSKNTRKRLRQLKNPFKFYKISILNVPFLCAPWWWVFFWELHTQWWPGSWLIFLAMQVWHDFGTMLRFQTKSKYALWWLLYFFSEILEGRTKQVTKEQLRLQKNWSHQIWPIRCKGYYIYVVTLWRRFPVRLNRCSQTGGGTAPCPHVYKVCIFTVYGVV